MTNIFPFPTIFELNSLFCPQMSFLEHIKPASIAYVLYKFKNYPCASCVHHFAHNMAILPQKQKVPHFTEV